MDKRLNPEQARELHRIALEFRTTAASALGALRRHDRRQAEAIHDEYHATNEDLKTLERRVEFDL
jgi:hypothetical protein